MENAIEKAIEMSIISAVDDFSSLTKQQKEILSVVFEKVKVSVEDIMIDMDISNHIKIMHLISSVIKIVEGLTVKITGVDKKVIALACGRKCIKMMKDHLDMLLLYDMIAETAMETMIDVSRHLHVKEGSECCMGFLSLCKK